MKKLVWSLVGLVAGLAVVAASCLPTPVPPDSSPAEIPDASEPVMPTDEADYFAPSSEITATVDLHETGSPTEVDIETWRLEIDGLVDSPLSLSYQEILEYPSVTEVVLLICPTVFQDNAEWTGVPVWRLLAEVGVQEEASRVVFEALPAPPLADYPGAGEISPYFSEIPLDEIMGNDSVFLAYDVNGEVLPVEHGYPLRVVAKDRFGYDWVKWLARITLK